MLGFGLAQLGDQGVDAVRVVVDAPGEQDFPGLGGDDRDPVELLGDIDACFYCHRTSGRSHGVVRPDSAVNALHSDGSQCLISGQNQVVERAAQHSEPSPAAGMKAIPAPPASADPRGPRTSLKGRA
ncbi:hypothetical protein, partial [Amycolatopsis thermoflava]